MLTPSIKDSYLQTGPTRNQLYNAHPVLLDRARIITHSVEEVVEIASTAILHRRPGSYFLAEPRVGKTTAIEVMKSVFPQRFPATPIFDVIAKNHKTFTEKNFFGDLLLDFQFANAMQGTAADRRLRCLNILLSLCRTELSDKLILLIDEGQSWGELEFELLRDLTNDLRRQGVTCVTLIFAHPNIETIVKANLLRKGRTDLTTRFLMKPYDFRGVNKLSDLQYIFAAFDSSLRHQYPSNSGISFSEFLLPEAFNDGWRLAGEAAGMWKSLSPFGGQKKESKTKFGMNLVMGAVRFFFLSSGSEANAKPRSEAWDEAVASSIY